MTDRPRRCVTVATFGMIAVAACGFPDVGYGADLPDAGAMSIDPGSGRDPAVRSGVDPVPSTTTAPDMADASSGRGAVGPGAPMSPSDASSLEGGSSGGAVGDGSSSGGGAVGTTSSSGGAGDSGGAGSSSGAGSGGSSGSSGAASSSGSSGAASSSGSSGGGAMTCSCSPNQLYPANVTCGGITVTALNLGLLCGQTAGFVGRDPGCGNSGTFITCTPDLSILACTATMSTVVQQCH